MTTCPVCCESFTVMLRKPVKCSYCEYTACTVCQKRYLTEGLLDAHCMNCQRGWNDEFLDMNFTKAFRTGAWKEHREKVLLEREMAILPSRQPRVEATLQYREAKKEMETVVKEYEELDRLIQALGRKRFGIEKRQVRYGSIMKGKEPPAWTLDDSEAKEPEEERAKFIMKCPDEECRGFLSSAYKCGTCQRWACPDCLVIKGPAKDDPHTCDQALVATVKMIVKDSSPCPKCGERISKVSGCNQMWCTKCKTAFDYKTGKISTGPIHNPHFYDFIHRNGAGAPELQGDLQNMEENNCGQLPEYYTLSGKFPLVGPYHVQPHYTYIVMSHRGFVDIERVRIPNLAGRFTEEDNGDLGAKYLMKDISKEDMKKELIAREIKRNKQIAVREVFEMVLNVGIIIYGRIMNDTFKATPLMDTEERGHVEWNSQKKANEYKRELEELRKYANRSLLKIGKMRGFAVPMLGDYFNYIPARAMTFWNGLEAMGEKAPFKNLW